MSSAEFSLALSHVLGLLLGRRDEAFTAEVPRKLDARQVMIAGMQGWSPDEDPILKDLGVRHIPPAAIADSSRPVLDWIAAEGLTHLAVRSEERRVGNACVSTCRSRWSPYH